MPVRSGSYAHPHSSAAHCLYVHPSGVTVTPLGGGSGDVSPQVVALLPTAMAAEHSEPRIESNRRGGAGGISGRCAATSGAASNGPGSVDTLPIAISRPGCRRLSPWHLYTPLIFMTTIPLTRHVLKHVPISQRWRAAPRARCSANLAAEAWAAWRDDGFRLLSAEPSTACSSRWWARAWRTRAT